MARRNLKKRVGRRSDPEALQKQRCRRCVYNEYRRCGVLFCVLPACVRAVIREADNGAEKAAGL